MCKCLIWVALGQTHALCRCQGCDRGWAEGVTAAAKVALVGVEVAYAVGCEVFGRGGNQIHLSFRMHLKWAVTCIIFVKT